MSLLIEVQKLPDSWYHGCIGRCQFQAKVYEIGSKYGINGGRVSKLSMWNASGEIIAYDRGWDKKPASDEHWELLWELLNNLEALLNSK